VRVWGVHLSNARFTVSAAGIIMNSSGRVLLLKHRFRGGSGWGIPGGFMEADEQAEAALRRELREEIGLELPSAELIRVRTLKNLRQIEIIFYGETDATVKTLNDEIEESGWFTPDSLPAGVPTDQVQMIKAVFNRRAKLER
jgi:ADP-ribose pyrophosphatase YjhB (NUDIX family)